jgi:rubrerythrin
MSSDKKRIAEILKTAIKGEEDGYNYYNYLVGKATNPEAKKKLEVLRDDEVRHKRTLREMYKTYVGGEIGELPDKGLGALSQVFKNGRIDQLKSEMEFINLAIEVELATSKYYQKERNLVDDPEFEKIFDQLAEEEYNHYQILQAEKDALGGNYYWFGLDNSAPLED